MTVQLFYIGIGGFLISILCQLVDEDDKFFTPEISEIPLQDIGVALGVGIGIKDTCLKNMTSSLPTLNTSCFFISCLIRQIWA